MAKFKVTHYPEAQPAHRFRYSIVHGKTVLATSEGYPTGQHAHRAVRGCFHAMLKMAGVPPYIVVDGEKQYRPIPFAPGSHPQGRQK